jgi:hypothetical protein
MHCQKDKCIFFAYRLNCLSVRVDLIAKDLIV